MSYRYYGPPAPKLIGYDPDRDLPKGHLARLIELVVEECVQPAPKGRGFGQPEFDPRLLIKVLVYAYATGVRSSRRMEQLCDESLPYLYLTRGDTPSYRTLCSARVEMGSLLEAVWIGLFTVAAEVGMKRIGHLAVDSSKLWADTSPDSVLSAAEFAPVVEDLKRILAEAKEIDEREDREGQASVTQLGQPVEREKMRDILRRVRKQQAQSRRAKKPAAVQPVGTDEMPVLPEMEAPAQPGEADETPPPSAYSGRMLDRIEAAVEAIEKAQRDEEKYLSLTDPDARMMYGGRVRSIRECHSFEVAADNGLLVAGQSTQEPHDYSRLEPLINEAQKHEPGGVTAVDADSGYYAGDAVGRLLDRGIDICVPDSYTACDLHRGDPVDSVRSKSTKEAAFTYDAQTDSFICEAGERLRFIQERKHHGQEVRVYKTRVDCQGCALKERCLAQPKARHRMLKVGRYHATLEAARGRFRDPAYQKRYWHRAEQVETVFGFLRAALGYNRWSLRGKEKVQCEATLFKLAYQIRKVQTTIAAKQKQADVTA